MKLLVTGRHGQLARSLVERARGLADIDLVLAARPEVDLAVPGSLATAIEAHRPDVVINAAAYTAVDRAESEEELARRINALAAGEGADAAARTGARFIQLSTDYVFDGDSERPWREDDPLAPINAYGRTKAAGEKAVMAANPDAVIVRTSWVLSPFGQNFVRTMIRLAAERAEIAVVADQRGSPTSALGLADALIALARRAVAGEVRGIYHLAGDGTASWAELAEQVMAASAAAGGPSAHIRRIPTSEFPTPATRPAFSVLDCTRAATELGIVLAPWQPSVSDIVERLVARSAP